MRKGYAQARGIFVATVAAIALCGLTAAEAGAVVPPTNCGPKKIGKYTYTIKTHKVSCRFAREWSSLYLLRNRRPTGFTCRKYDPRQTRLRFRCYRGEKDFFAIRR